MNIRRPFSLLLLSGLFGLTLFVLTPLAQKPREVLVNIDTNTRGEEISPYVYGQFIEHLGRCIYGGLWSEMLEDRKFYFPVTGEAPAWEMFKPGDSSWQGEGFPYELLVRSPWMVLGDKSSVQMDGNRVYVGEHTPKLSLAGGSSGLSQERISLVGGREYVGRVVLAGETLSGSVEVSLAWGAGASDRETVAISGVGREFKKYPLRFKAGRSTENGRLEITAEGSGTLWVGTVSLMPADNLYGWRADTVKLLKRLDSPVYRWPGGNFVSGYNWKDGIGDPDLRPPRKNPAWKGIEHNDVGIHEFIALCREIGSEPYIAVNTGLGGVEAAAEEVEYVNGSITTPMGKLRKENGHSEPFGVKWWAVGNEMYGDWQLGHMPLSEYVLKHNRIVGAMKEVDPAIQAIAVGAIGDWSRQMLTSCANHMDLISEHIYWQDRASLLEHVEQAVLGIRKIAEAHREYRNQLPSLGGKDIRIALDEWNYWYGPNEYGELGVQYFLQDALGIAAGLHEMFRNSDLFYMANYAQTVNVIGAIKTTDTEVQMETTGLVLELYRSRYGKVPIEVSGDFAPLDIVAAWEEDQTRITLGVVNPTDDQVEVSLSLDGVGLNGSARQWVIAGEDRWAHNAPGEEESVQIRQRTRPLTSEGIHVPPLSVSIVSLGTE